jgi:hypothetical protein
VSPFRRAPLRPLILGEVHMPMSHVVIMLIVIALFMIFILGVLWWHVAIAFAVLLLILMAIYGFRRP